MTDNRTCAECGNAYDDSETGTCATCTDWAEAMGRLTGGRVVDVTHLLS